MYEHVVFDFDGTLVDTSAGILGTLQRCLERAGLRSRVALSSALIGPPLRALVTAALGAEDAALIERIEADFRRDYDATGYRATQPYPGIEAALQALTRAGRTLHIVTNKRRLPTQQILATLGWSASFATLGTLDSSGSAANKAEVVAQLLARLGAAGPAATLVGDSRDDAQAARHNRIDFAWASWGYGRDPALAEGAVRLADPGEIAPYVLGGGRRP
jgi:phosphoglycolate phosphatase